MRKQCNNIFIPHRTVKSKPISFVSEIENKSNVSQLGNGKLHRNKISKRKGAIHNATV